MACAIANRRPVSSTCCGARGRRRGPPSLPPTSDAVQERRRRGASRRLARRPRLMGGRSKGGSNAATPGHLDLGSFVIDALGERWAVDPRAGLLRSARTTSARAGGPTSACGTESHNTMLVDGRNQDLQARPRPSSPSATTAYRAFAVTDLTAAYRPAVTRARRGVALIDGRDVLIQDEIEGAGTVRRRVADGDARAGDHRRTCRRRCGRTGGQRHCRCVEPAGATLRAEAAVAPAPQAPSDVVMVRVVLPAGEPAVSASSCGSRPATVRRRR